MASSKVFGLVVLIFLLNAHANEAKRIPNVVAILKNCGQFNTLLALLQARNLVTPINNLLRTSRNGITIFAPTDTAFNNLPPGTLDKLTPEQQTVILLLHVAPRYYSFRWIGAARNPVPTLAPGLTLNITVSSRRPFVSSGVVTTPIKPPLYSKYPLSIFPIGAVLIPRGWI